MNNLWDFTSSTLFQTNINNSRSPYSSLCYPPRLPLTTSMRKTTVGSDETYRPDKVSFRLYGNPLLSWILDDANSFYSCADYTINKEILYPSFEALDLMGISYEYSSYKDENFA